MPLLDTVSVADLRPWLVRTLEPICDADPEVLADYVLALLKHDAPEAELRNMFVNQLEDFLDKECPPFVDQLFAALRSKSYMPYAAASPPARSTDTGIPIPLDALMPPSAAGHKRPSDGDDFDRPPPKGPRLHAEGNFSRYGSGPPQNNGGGWRGGPRNGPPTGPRGGGYVNGNGRPPNDMNQRGGRRGLCKDYHNLGYCARGALCPYSHGDDAIAPQMPFGVPQGGPPGMPFMPVIPGAQYGMPFPMAPAGAGYDPTQAHMDMGNRQPPGGPVIQDLTPQLEGGAGPRPRHERHEGPNRGRGRGGRGPPDQARGTFDRPTFGDDSSDPARPPRKSENKTLVVEKIPTEHLSLDGVNSWFKRFGTVTNVAIDAKGAKALVSFATPNEAHAAWKSEDAVFNNRFVKVFWHRPMEGHGAVGTKLLAASAPLIANLTGKDQQPADGPSPSSVAKTEPAAPKKKAGDAAALAAKQQVLERQIAEQKTLMARFESASSADEKKDLRERLRKLTEEMKSGIAAPASASAEEKEKERLDKELELQNAVKSELSNPDGDVTMSTTEDLKAKLEKLREEAASLGISDPSSVAGFGGAGGYRGYRGRGRGARGYYRGRGAMPMRNMKLDNRPKKLLIKGTTGDEEALQTVRSWFDTMGQVESANVLPSGDIVVAFQSRSLAEQAYARPSNISGIGQVDVAWHVDTPGPGSAPSAAKETMDGPEDTFMRDDEPRSPRRDRDEEDDHRLEDDEPRWDDDEDDRRRRR